MTTATLTYSLPTTRTDGSALSASDITSVDIYDAVDSAPAVLLGSVTDGSNQFLTAELATGTHTFVAIVNAGVASDPSNTAVVTVGTVVVKPSAITDLAATLNP